MILSEQNTQKQIKRLMNAEEFPINVDELNVWIEDATSMLREEDAASEADTIDAEDAQRDMELLLELMYADNFNADDLDPDDEPIPEWH